VAEASRVRVWRPDVPGIDEVFHARFVDHAYPPHTTRRGRCWSSTTAPSAASRRGDFAPADPTLADLVGRPVTSLREFLGATLGPAR
jgi:hypothetical protein